MHRLAIGLVVFSLIFYVAADCQADSYRARKNFVIEALDGARPLEKGVVDLSGAWKVDGRAKGTLFLEKSGLGWKGKFEGLWEGGTPVTQEIIAVISGSDLTMVGLNPVARGRGSSNYVPDSFKGIWDENRRKFVGNLLDSRYRLGEFLMYRQTEQ